MFYSKSTGGFYTHDVHGTNIPHDAVEITAQEHAALLAGQAAGQRIVAGPNGHPKLEDHPLPTHAELVEQTKVTARAMRLPIISILDGMQSSALTDGDLDRAEAIEVAKQGLKDITKIDLSGCQSASEMTTLVLTRYAQIASALPISAVTAFAQVLE